MDRETMLAYSEVNEVLNLLEDECLSKIPQKFRDFVFEMRDEEYKPILSAEKSLLEQNVSEEAMIILATIYLSFLCDSEEEKQELLKDFAKNEKEKQEFEEKYNPDNLFKKKNKQEEQKNEEIQMVEYKDKNFIQKIISKIIGLFCKKGKNNEAK